MIMAGTINGWSRMWENQQLHCPTSYPTGGFIIDSGTNMNVRLLSLSIEARGNLETTLYEITHNYPTVGKCRVKLFRMQGNNIVEVNNGTNMSSTIFHVIMLGD